MGELADQFDPFKPLTEKWFEEKYFPDGFGTELNSSKNN